MEDFKKYKIMSPIGLQIDNLVYNQHGEMHCIRAMDFSRFNQPKMDQDYGLYAIPLSPEVLEKCGFTGEVYSTQDGAVKFWEYRQFFEIEQPLKSGEMFYYCANDYIQITSLHQLQNLTFALSGKELTYRP